MRILFGIIAVIVIALLGAGYYVFYGTTTVKGLTGPAVDLFIDFEVLGQTDLNGEGIAPLAGRTMRTRYWTIPSGSIVPVHEHANRPATIYTRQGAIFEYRNDRRADDPVLHETGGLSLEEGHNLAHWWKNKGPEEVLLVAFDIYQTADDIAAPGTVAATPEAADRSALPASQGVDSDVLGSVDLGAHFQGRYGAGYGLFTYKVTVAPGGVYGAPTEAGEPLHVFVDQGTVEELRAGGPGKTLTENGFSQLDGGAAAAWRNTGAGPAVLIVGTLEALDE